MQAHPSVSELLGQMRARGASDLFLCAGARPALRVHGQMQPLELPVTSPELLSDFVDGLLQTPERRARFEEGGDADLGLTLGPERFRINLSRSRGALSLVARHVPAGNLELEALRLPEAVAGFADAQRGLVLVCGATGSGKSTTVAAMVNRINQGRRCHIVTIEDPIEFLHTDAQARVTQREIGSDTESFHAALRHVVRQSPDVIVLGELRDAESVQVALQACLTGHLVLATVHTHDAAQSIRRLMTYVPVYQREQLAFDLSLALVGVIAQRLVPRVDGSGRVLASEVITLTPPARKLLVKQDIEGLNDLVNGSRAPELRSFNRDLLDLMQEGLITFEAGMAASTNRDAFALHAQGMATGSATFSAVEGTGTEMDMKALLSLVVARGASDLHLCVGRPPILRRAGKLQSIGERTLSVAEMRMLLFSVMSGAQRSKYELERDLDFALAIDGGKRFRVNAYFQRGQMAASLRIINDVVPSAEELGIPRAVLKLGSRPHGLLLVVGPTGSGKSTTLACLVDRINRSRPCRIVTVEDPIEYVHGEHLATVDQREIGQDTGSFAQALRYVLRQDPDVILVGEMRDLETVGAALTAAETGHLVLATLHSNDAIQAIDRIIDVFPANAQAQVRAQLSAGLLGVVSQRLLPAAEDPQDRVAVFEVMVGTSAIRNLIRENKLHQAASLLEAGRGVGMITMDKALQQAVAAGKIRADDAIPYMRNPRAMLPEPPKPEPSSPDDGAEKSIFGWGRKR